MVEISNNGHPNVHSDHELLSLIREDSWVAFNEIYNRYWPALYRHIYSFDIFEKGTENYPYNSGSPMVINGFTLKPNEGRVTSIFMDNGFNFQAGKSKLFIITDATAIVTSPGRYTYVSGGRLTDLSQYFQ